MNKLLLSLLMFVISSAGFSSTPTFILLDISHNKQLVSEGEIDKRISPCSTFKIPLSLMGFEEKILQNENAPLFKYKPEHEAGAVIDKHKQDQTPKTWMQYSCVWFSQDLTKQLGMEKFQNYVNRLEYGNKDVSGDPDKKNGLSASWLGSSLKISAKEQLSFIRHVAMKDFKHPFSAQTYQYTHQILCLGPFGPGWTLFGKTGSGYHRNEDGSKDTTRMIGWFVGWLEKGDEKLAFVYHTNNIKTEEGFGGPVAKERALKRLEEILKS